MGYFKDWWKSLFSGSGETDELGFPMLKRENISEPVQTLVRLFKENPKRFKFEYETHALNNSFNYYSHIQPKYAVSCVKAIDSHTNEFWKFELNLYWGAVGDSRYQFTSITKQFGEHMVYPVLGYMLTCKPNWVSEDEVEHFKETLVPHFLDRVNRYREIVNYRKERREESHKRKTELDKKKERERLVNIYKGE